MAVNRELALVRGLLIDKAPRVWRVYAGTVEGLPGSRENAGITGPIRNSKKRWFGKLSCSG